MKAHCNGRRAWNSRKTGTVGPNNLDFGGEVDNDFEHMIEHLIQADTRLFLLVNHTLSNPVFDRVMPVLTDGRFWVLPILAAAGLFFYHWRRTALAVLALALVTVSVSDPLCNRIVKPSVRRLRPCNVNVNLPDGRFLLGRKSSFSFPSSHAMNVFAQAMLWSLLYRRKKIAIPAFMLAALIAFSRVYVGVHYPLDVVAGAVLGMGCGGLVYGVCAGLITRHGRDPGWLERLRSPVPRAGLSS